MHFSAIALISMLIMPLACPASATEYGTRGEALAMTQRAQAKFRKDGLEATYRAINGGSKEFNDRDLYVFSIGFTGIEYANGQVPTLVGKNVLDIKDQDGKFVVQDMIALVKQAGHGWINYRWLNPVTKTIEDKSAYVERVGITDSLVGVGIYKNEQPNENNIGLISGSPNSDATYLQAAYDMAEVLNDGDNLRVFPIVGIGGPRNIRDVRYVKGIDIGLTQTNILNNFRHSNERLGQTENKIVYIAKLFNEEVHLVARTSITSVGQLKGLKVNLDAKGSGTSYSMRDIFKALDIEVEEVGMSQTEALERVRSGEIAATALIAGKPARSIAQANGVHFVPIPFSQPLIANYLPTSLTHDDYPDLIPAGEPVETIAVGTVLITYNWPRTSDRYQRIEKFIAALFSKIDEFRKPPHHPKWREVNLAAVLPSWTRFEAAQNWLDYQRAVAGTPGARQTLMAGDSARREVPANIRASQSEGLFQDFLRWQQQMNSGSGRAIPSGGR
jgi:TRAP-type uncharacterized transport system substrate-binding protein